MEQNSEEKKPVVSEKSDTVNNAPVSTGKIIKFNIDPEVAGKAILYMYVNF